MSERIEINEENLESIVGGNITFDWNGKVGHCGLNGDKSYTFDSRTKFVNSVIQCFNQGMKDYEALEALIASGIIYK